MLRYLLTIFSQVQVFHKYSRQKYYCYLPSKCKIIFVTVYKWSLFQYCFRNIGLFSIDPHFVIALPTFRQQKLSVLISLLQYLYEFADWFMVSFLYCFPSNYCDSKKFTVIFLLSPLRARKSENYRNSWKSNNFRERALKKEAKN